MLNKINNKEQQAVAGNWGHPRKENKHIRVDDIDISDVPRHAGKRKKKIKKVYKNPYEVCPFCENELLKLPDEKRNGFYLCWPNREKFCRSCGALQIENGCPACKHNTWCLKGEYKHMNMGCGFRGRKR